ncbi:unnamed protein product [Durusdinium trenchii]|uniref:Uncharacterized protein n=1 Tax=Durusdinium trenchii TaxID=1381693 RepID=A0ABP0I818_9DINO
MLSSPLNPPPSGPSHPTGRTLFGPPPVPPPRDLRQRFMGGADLRADSAPIRLDADAPPDPRQKLESMRRGLVAVGVDSALFEQVVDRLAPNGDLEKACEVLKTRFATALNALQ